MKNQVAWRQLAVREPQEKKPVRAATAGDTLRQAPQKLKGVFLQLWLRLFEHTQGVTQLCSTPRFAGEYTARVTPVPIPNTEVKPRWADGTARVSVWERR